MITLDRDLQSVVRALNSLYLDPLKGPINNAKKVPSQQESVYYPIFCGKIFASSKDTHS
jgi:hypothetical protein